MSEHDWFHRTFRAADDVAVLPDCWEPFGGYSAERFRDEFWPMLQRAQPDMPAKPSRRQLPPDEPQGLTLSAPIPRFGVRAILTASQGDRNAQLVALLPRTSEGVEHRVRIDHVALSADRVQLRVHGTRLEADGDPGMSLAFYDQDGPASRCHYEAGAVVAFVLCGIAVSCQPAQADSLTIPTPQWMREAGETKDTATVHLDQMKSLLPLGRGAPPDIHWYRGRVTASEPLHMAMLGQRAWQLRVAVSEELDGREVELGLLVTERLLSAGAPEVGSFIEGVLWLQGGYWRTISEAA